MTRLSQAAKGDKDVIVPSADEYKFRLFCEMEVSFLEYTFRVVEEGN